MLVLDDPLGRLELLGRLMRLPDESRKEFRSRYPAIDALNGQALEALSLLSKLEADLWEQIERPIQAALTYASRGWAVFPLHTSRPNAACSCGSANCSNAGKHPRTPNGLKNATTDEEAIRSWWGKWPDANIGIATGRESGLVVVDEDDFDGMIELERRFGSLPETVISETGKPGRHFYFMHPGTIEIRNRTGIIDGIDIRADGGYVVAPPSLHISGRRYRWKGAPDAIALAPLPAGLLDLILAPKPRQNAKKPSRAKTVTTRHSRGALEREVQAVTSSKEGMRNSQLNIAAFTLGRLVRRGHLSEDEVFDRLLAAADKAGLDEREARRTIESGLKASQVDTGSEDGLDGEDNSTSNFMQLVEEGGMEFFHTPDGKPYATFENAGHRETWAVESKGFRSWLRRQNFESGAGILRPQDFQERLGLIVAHAEFDGPERAVNLRVAEHEGSIYLDLCDREWRAVEITASGWRVVTDFPVRFRRTKGMAALPVPVTGGDLNELRKFVNIRDENDWMLAVGYVVGSLAPRGPYAILVVQGEHGSAKSSSARAIRDLVDPSAVSLRSPPRKDEDLWVAASSAHMLAFDNLSGIPVWLSDALCMVATGGGLSKRELYTDGEESLISATKPIITTGIDAVATRGDFADRSIILNLPRMAGAERKPEREFWAEYEEARPRILGALCSAISGSLKNSAAVRRRLTSLPRMADFAIFVAAAESALGWEDGSFMSAYHGNREEAAARTLEADVVATAVESFMRAGGGKWQGTATDLLEKLEEVVPERVRHSKRWPEMPNALSKRLKRAAPALLEGGIDVALPDGKQSGHARKRLITITAAPEDR